jgi:hypothetical protein
VPDQHGMREVSWPEFVEAVGIYQEVYQFDPRPTVEPTVWQVNWVASAGPDSDAYRERAAVLVRCGHSADHSILAIPHVTHFVGLRCYDVEADPDAFSNVVLVGPWWWFKRPADVAELALSNTALSNTILSNTIQGTYWPAVYCRRDRCPARTTH